MYILLNSRKHSKINFNNKELCFEGLINHYIYNFSEDDQQKTEKLLDNLNILSQKK